VAGQHWYRLTLTCPLGASEVAQGLLAKYSIFELVLVPGETSVQLTWYESESDFSPDRFAALKAEVEALGALVPEAAGDYRLDYRLEELPDWSEEWRKYYKPLTFGRLQIVPTWLAETTPQPEGTVRLLLDPGRAFGTGQHESTQLILKLFERETLAGARILDLGTGSGILALAALKLGADYAVATEVDAEALEVASANAELNGLGAQVEFVEGSLYKGITGTFDFILCNIKAEIVQEAGRAAPAYLAPGGVFLGSGFYEAASGPLVETLKASGFSTEVITLGEWAAVRAHLA